MEDDISSDNNRRNQSSSTANTTNKRAFGSAAGAGAGGGGVGGRDREVQKDDGFKSGDSEVWDAFKSNFQEVQTVLDRNRVLIQQVNANHQSRVHENLVENVGLINEINGNISKVVSLYSDLSSNFSGAFTQQKATAEDQSNAAKADR